MGSKSSAEGGSMAVMMTFEENRFCRILIRTIAIFQVTWFFSTCFIIGIESVAARIDHKMRYRNGGLIIISFLALDGFCREGNVLDRFIKIN